MSGETRPDPDHLLETIADEARRSSRGQLKIFFGACAGVGKTYAMLQAAHRLLAEGVAVLAGVVETHERDETRRLLQDLPVLPLREVSYHDNVLKEFDLDGALAAKPGLILVDELAHTNAPGSRHAKRWQDVEELLAAGIDVFTTLNVQHLESVNDIVGGITGIRVRETVPDQVFNDAGEVILVDLPPDDLLSRLAAGKVYLADAAERARRNFFRKGNLIALRELALRRMADRVDVDVRSYRTRKTIADVWQTRERLMVCIDASPSYERMIREASRLARRLQADWIVVHVDVPHGGRQPKRREALNRLGRLAESLGAEVATVPGEDIARTLLDYARLRNATKLILGQSARRWRLPWQRPLGEVISQANPDLGLMLLVLPRAARSVPGVQAGRFAGVQGFALVLALLACAFATLVAALLLRFFDLSNVVMLFLLTVVLVALNLGRAAGALAALLSVLSLDFFFVPPRLSFTVSDTQYLFTFALMLVVALIIGQLAARLRYQASTAIAREHRATALARIARDLSAALKVEQIDKVATQEIAPLLQARTCLLLPTRDGRLGTGAGQADFVDAGVAQWVFDHEQPAGLGTQTLAAAKALYLPLKAPMQVRGVLVAVPQEKGVSSGPEDRRLLDACCSLIALALERIHFVDVAQETLVRMEGERLRNALLASVSHDLRTPLTAIRGLAETLEHGAGLPEAERIAASSAIRMQADELQRLVTNLLDMARMQGEGARLDLQWHALSEIVASALARLAPVLSGHRIETRLDPDLPLVELDAVLFERVLANLLDNAAKYTPRGATILIRARASDDRMHLYVEDDGPGFGGHDPEALFEPFARGLKETAIAGAGLGLALCRRIVEAHKGTIGAEPRQPHGTRFTISLPLGRPPEIEREPA